MSTARRHIALAAAAHLAGCAPGAPANPTWVEDVRPILQANCVRCHMPPQINGAPVGFRLDQFDDELNPDETVKLRGAGTMAQFIAVRAGLLGEMPPDYPLSDYQREVLQNWCADGACVHDRDIPNDPERPDEGARRNNHPPTISLDTPLPATTSGEEIVIAYRLDDEDGDLVQGEIRLDQGDPDSALPGQIQSGAGTLLWDSGGTIPDTYSLVAVVDDGTAEDHLPLGTVTVGAPSGAARLRLAVELERDGVTGPLRSDEVLVDAESLVIHVAVTDPVTEDVRFDAVAFRGSDEVTIGEDIATTRVGGEVTGTVPWVTSGLTPGERPANWRLRITARAGTTSRTMEFGPFIVSHRMTNEVFLSNPIDPAPTDIQQAIFAKHCSYCCHVGPGPIADLDYNWGVYQTDPDPGVGDHVALIYKRVVMTRDMPPRSYRESALALCTTSNGPPNLPEGDMTDDERDQLADWILGGAPEGPAP